MLVYCVHPSHVSGTNLASVNLVQRKYAQCGLSNISMERSLDEVLSLRKVTNPSCVANTLVEKDNSINTLIDPCGDNNVGAEGM